MELELGVVFPIGEKEEVSGIDMQNRITLLMFEILGRSIRLVEVKFRFPYPLIPGEWAQLLITQVKAPELKGVDLRQFSVRMTGTKSNRVVMRGTFMTAPKN